MRFRNRVLWYLRCWFSRKSYLNRMKVGDITVVHGSNTVVIKMQGKGRWSRSGVNKLQSIGTLSEDQARLYWEVRGAIQTTGESDVIDTSTGRK